VARRAEETSPVKGEGKREKGEGRREKGEGRREDRQCEIRRFSFSLLPCPFSLDSEVS
jgi:hypothetical protein